MLFFVSGIFGAVAQKCESNQGLSASPSQSGKNPKLFSPSPNSTKLDPFLNPRMSSLKLVGDFEIDLEK